MGSFFGIRGSAFARNWRPNGQILGCYTCKFLVISYIQHFNAITKKWQTAF